MPQFLTSIVLHIEVAKGPFSTLLNSLSPSLSNELLVKKLQEIQSIRARFKSSRSGQFLLRQIRRYCEIHNKISEPRIYFSRFLFFLTELATSVIHYHGK